MNTFEPYDESNLKHQEPVFGISQWQQNNDYCDSYWDEREIIIEERNDNIHNDRWNIRFSASGVFETLGKSSDRFRH